MPGDLSTADRRLCLRPPRHRRAARARLRRSTSSISATAFPAPDAATRSGALARLAPVPPGAPIVIDGLALGVLPEAAKTLAATHPVVALVHHPLALESGITAAAATALAASERRALAAVRHVITTSPSTRRALIADYGVAAASVTVALPGNDPVAASPRPRREAVTTLARRRRGGAAQGLRRPDRGACGTGRSRLAPRHCRRSRARLRRGGRPRTRRSPPAVSAGGSGCAAPSPRTSSRRSTVPPTCSSLRRATRATAWRLPRRSATACRWSAPRAGAIPETVPPDAGILVAPDDVAALGGGAAHDDRRAAGSRSLCRRGARRRRRGCRRGRRRPRPSCASSQAVSMSFSARMAGAARAL